MKNKIVIFGTDKKFADEIAREIGNRLQTTEDITENVKYPFDAIISTKYYSAHIVVDYCDKLPEEKFDNSTDAVILAWNEVKINIDKFNEIVKATSPNIFVIVCPNPPKSLFEKAILMQGEVIGLNEVSEDEREKVGFERLIEVLEANMWDGSERKKFEFPGTKLIKEKIEKQAKAKTMSPNDDFDYYEDSNDEYEAFDDIKPKYDFETKEFWEQDDADIFKRLVQIKQQCQQMNEEERHDFAMRAAIAFSEFAEKIDNMENVLF